MFAECPRGSCPAGLASRRLRLVAAGERVRLGSGCRLLSFIPAHWEPGASGGALPFPWVSHASSAPSPGFPRPPRSCRASVTDLSSSSASPHPDPPPPKHRAAQAPPDQSLSVPGSWQGPDPSVGTGLRSVTLYPAHAQGPQRVRTARPYLHGPASFPRLARVPRPPHPPGPHPHGASHVGLVRSRPTDTQGPQGRCLRNGQPSAAPWLWTAGLGGRRGTARAA